MSDQPSTQIPFSDLPEGTVTFLFTDIEGSTQLLHRLRDKYAILLEEHNRIMREAFTNWDGHEVDTQGDAFFVSFSRATQAVGAAAKAQRKLSEHIWPERVAVRVRMGIHTGESWTGSEGYVGMDVHRAARIAHVGNGGQVLLSETTTSLVRDELPLGVSLLDLGRHLLKDIHRPERISQLVIEGLPSEFSPLTSLEMLPPESARPPRKVGACPYRGLSAFQEVDEKFYFGRETFVDALEHAIQTRKLVAVIVGSSGSGKSSAIFAGLLPRLRKEGGYQLATLRPGAQPFYSLAEALVVLLEPGLSKTDLLAETRNLAERLSKREVGLAEVVRRIQKDSKDKSKVLLVVDQFEELYTLCTDADLQKAFIDELLTTVEASRTQRDGLAVVLLTMRADFMGQALAHRPFADALQEASLMLGPMTRQELHTAIERPAETQGAAFEPGLVERILDDVGEKPGNLPLLQFTLTQLWERQTDGWLTHSDYEAMGCVEGALASYADQVHASLDEVEQELTRHALVQLVQPGEGTEDTRRIATRDELGAESWKLVQLLADKRLVVVGRDAQGHDIAEVVHEALIHRWGKFREWMDNDRAFRLWQERLRASLRQWQESGKDEGALLAGAPLAVAQDWLSQRGGELNTAEIAYIQASQALQAKQQKERQRRRQWAFIGISVGLVISIALTAFALFQRQEAITQRQEALRQASAGLAAQALAEMDSTQSERAVLLALEALEHYPYTPQAEAALARAVQETLPYREIETLGGTGLYNHAWSPDGKYIALGGGGDGSGKNAVQIISSTTNQVIKELPLVLPYAEGEDCGVYNMVWSPDSRRLALTSNDFSSTSDCHNFMVFNSTNGNLLFTLETHGELALDWSPDGQTLLSGSEDGVTRLWDAASGTLLHAYPGQAIDVVDAQFSPDGARFACASRDGTVLVRDIAEGSILFTFGMPSTYKDRYVLIGLTGGYSLAWSPDGTFLATGSPNGIVEIWDTTSGENLMNLMGHSGGIDRMIWSPDGRYLITNSSQDSSIRLWEAATGRQVLVLNGSWWTLDLSPDGRELASRFVGARSIRVWDLSPLPPVFPNSRMIFGDVKWSPDGKYLAANTFVGEAANDYHGTTTNLEVLIDWSPDSTRIAGPLFNPARSVIVNAKNGEVLVELNTPPPEPDGAYFSHGWSPDGSMVASSNYPGCWTVIWDPNTGDELARTPTYNCHLMRPMFSPDSQLLATGCNYTEGDTPVRIFNAHTGELVRELPSQDGWSISPVWSPDGKYLAVSYEKAMVRIWDTSTWQVVQSFTAHKKEVWDVNWSPDGTRLVSGDWSGIGYVWDFATGHAVQSFTLDPMIYSVDWSPDGKYVAGDITTTIIRHAWQTTQELIDYANECCVMRELTPEERQQFGLP